MPEDKTRACIERAWNAGMTLSQANRFMESKGCADKQLLIRRWRELKLSYGCACICSEKVADPAPAELSQLVQRGMTYGEWKGITGPGAMLRSILADRKSAN